MTWLPGETPPQDGPPTLDDATGLRIAATACAAAHGRCEACYGAATVVAVRRGWFTYEAHGYTRLVGPGALIAGLAGQPYATTHEHGAGDACAVYRLDAAGWERLGEDLGLAGRPARAGVLLPAPAPEAWVGDDERAWQLLAHARRALADPRQEAPPSHGRADRDRAQAAAALIEDRYMEDLALADLAAAVHTSPFHFLRAFKRETGLTPHQHLLRTRLRHAARLLRATDRPVTEVALDVGFQDLSHFTRSFKAHLGRPPGAFRQGA